MMDTQPWLHAWILVSCWRIQNHCWQSIRKIYVVLRFTSTKDDDDVIELYLQDYIQVLSMYASL